MYFLKRNYLRLIMGSLTVALAPVSFSLVANPTSQNAAYVEDVTIKAIPGNQINRIVLKNSSSNKFLNAMNVKPQSSTLDIRFEGSVKCAKNKKIDFKEARAFFGPVERAGNTIKSPKALFSANYDPSITYRIANKWITEAGNLSAFKVPLSKINKKGSSIGIDPIKELDKALQDHMAKGKTKLSFYQADHNITLTRPISLAGVCKKNKKKGALTWQPGYDTKLIKITIAYKGDKKLKADVKVKAGLIPNSQQLAAPNVLLIDQVKFQPNMPHYFGQCAPKANPKIQMSYRSVGKGKAQIGVSDLSPNQSSYLHYETKTFSSDKTGHHKVTFSYPLAQKLAANSYWRTIGKTISHPFRISVRTFNKKQNRWNPWKKSQKVIWKHRCEAKTNIQGPGAINGFGQANSQDSNSARIKPKNIQPLMLVKPKRSKIPGKGV